MRAAVCRRASIVFKGSIFTRPEAGRSARRTRYTWQSVIHFRCWHATRNASSCVAFFVVFNRVVQTAVSVTLILDFCACTRKYRTRSVRSRIPTYVPEYVRRRVHGDTRPSGRPHMRADGYVYNDTSFFRGWCYATVAAGVVYLHARAGSAPPY